MELLYTDNSIIVCIKPAGVLSTDEPGGLPSLVREALGDPDGDVRTVHRLDRVVSGLMVLARSKSVASALGKQVMEHRFQKEYLAVVHGTLPEDAGTFRDLLLRSKPERKTYVVTAPGKDVQEAVLDYTVLGRSDGLSLVRITLRTGRTHQIRCQFSSRGFPLVGDRKYGTPEEDCGIALWSYRLTFDHPKNGERMDISHRPPAQYPWTAFTMEKEIL